MKLNFKIISNFIIVFLVGVFLYVVFVFFSPRQEDTIDDYNESLFEKQILEIVLKTNILYEGSKLNDIVVLDHNSNDFYLSEILDADLNLCFYVPLEGCDPCVDQMYDIIKESIRLKNSNIKVYLLVKSPNFRSFVASQDDKSNITSLYIKEGWLGLDLEKLDTPFLFMANENLVADQFFLVDKSLEQINRFYVEKIISQF